ncbi:MAG TPA: alpha/beta fold hydrolase [Xanthomonadales bacterium]|nr:alpha/beta fold hydrolase [Xanthomonadales bacterium]
MSRAGKAAPELLMLHGWGMNNGAWGRLVERLGDGLSVQAVELPGHGTAPYGTGPFSAAGLASALARGSSATTWLGWSLGGQLALRAALDFPGRVQRMILFATGASFIARPHCPWGMDPADFRRFRAVVEADPAGALRRFNGWQVAGSEWSRETLRELNRCLGESAPDARALANGLDILGSLDLSGELERLRCSVLLLAGAEDRLVAPEAVRRTAALIPGAQFGLIPGAGHAPFISHPEAVLEAVSAFLERDIAA